MSQQDQQRAERGPKTDLTRNSTFEQLWRSLAPIVDIFRHYESVRPGTPSCKARSLAPNKGRMEHNGGRTALEMDDTPVALRFVTIPPPAALLVLSEAVWRIRQQPAGN